MTATHRERLLRRLEHASHLTTTAAFLLTILLVTTGYASELNVVAETLFSEAGWAVTGVLALTAITAAFWYYERHLHDHPRLILTAGVVLALAGVLDLGVNLYILTTAGWPETIHWDAYAPPAAIVALAGLAAITRRKIRPTASKLRIHSPKPQQAAAVAFALLLVLSGVGPFASLGGLVVDEHDGAASAQSDSTNISDLTTYKEYDQGHFTVNGPNSVSVESIEEDHTDHLYAKANDVSETGGTMKWRVDVTGTSDSWEWGWLTGFTSGTYADTSTYTGNVSSMFGVVTHHNNDGEAKYRLSRWNGTTDDRVETEIIADVSDNDAVYITLEVDSENNAAYGRVYSDANRTNLLGESSISINPDREYSYVSPVAGQNDSTNNIAGISADITQFSVDGVTGPLPSDPTGQALDQTGDPVPNATVVATYEGQEFDQKLIDGKPFQELQNEPTKHLDSWQGQLDGLGVDDPTEAGTTEWYDHLKEQNDARVVSHTGEDWGKEGTSIDFLVPTPTYESSQELPGVTLRNPTVVYDDDDTVTLSTWSGTDTSLAFQDGLDQQLPGETQPSNITVSRVDPLGDEIWSETHQTRAVYYDRHQGNCGWSDDTGTCIKNHHAVALDLEPGVYHASPGDSDITTTFVVTGDGEYDSLTSEIDNWAENRSSAVSDYNQQLRDAHEDLPIETTSTNESGYYTLSPPANAESASVTVTKTGAEGVVNDPESVTKPDLRESIEAETRAHFSQEAPTGLDFQDAFDARHRDDTFQRVCERMDSVADDTGAPYYGDKHDVAINGGDFDIHGDRVLTNGLQPPEQACAAMNIAEQILSGNLAGVLPPFLDVDDLEDKFAVLAPLLDANPELKSLLEDETGVNLDSTDPDDYTTEEIEAVVTEGGEIADEYASGAGSGGAAPGSGGGIPSSGDTGTTAPTVGDGDQTVDETAETLTEEWPVTGVDDWSNAEVMVRIHWSNGTTTALGTNSSYVDIRESSIGSDTVQLENYPLNASDPPVARTKLTVVSSEGVGNSPDSPDSVVRNPSFDGDIPRLQSIQVSSLTPKAGSNITVAATPADPARFGSVESVTIDGPDCERSVAPDGDDTSIETCDTAGDTRVHVQFSNSGNASFTETFVVETRDTASQRPASIRGMVGPTGRWAIASDGLHEARIDIEDGASKISLVAISEPDDVPQRYAAYATGMDTPQDADVETRIVAGDAEQTVRKQVGVTLHSSRPSNGTLYYRNGDPVPAEEDHPMGRLRFQDDQLVYESFTSDTGELALRVNQDPGFVERVRHWLGTTSLNPLSLSVSGDVVLVGSPIVVLLLRRRRGRPPNGGETGASA